MRWNQLFEDLEGQLAHELSGEELDLEAEEERHRLGELSVRDRLVALHESSGDIEHQISLVLTDAGRLTGANRLRVHPISFGRDWFSAELHAIENGPLSTARAQCIIPFRAIAGVSLTRAQVRATLAARDPFRHADELAGSLPLQIVLRDLCRRRLEVGLIQAYDELHGTIDRVGRDHLDLAVHDAGSARRESAVREIRMIALDSLLLVKI
jgi:hypothetical protein